MRLGFIRYSGDSSSAALTAAAFRSLLRDWAHYQMFAVAMR